ncbi:hypothetical protein SAMN04487977_101446 [Treponema bryantii]|uniref:Uncharacterized protein n=1 Tax=Treponema bryantii TaxID=163 RepID=A0A1H9ASC8_9SPIR|nr:hypothetical protein [Treponema bryantii]SEP79441.1 hypothetical protein SAMN04487977_101446 [Treponema bryantii]
MTSCQSVKVVYKYVIPNYDCPKFPALERTINEDESWNIPKESVDLLAEFYLEYSKLEATIKHDKELYGKVEE